MRKPVSTGKVEHDLSHMESHLYTIGLAAIEGKDYEYAEIANRELSDLERIGSELESCNIADSDKEIFQQHIGVIRAVWLEMQKLGSSSGTIQQLIEPERG
jgi:membrane carboxypeptidase/penicillin-binding protein